MACRFLFLLAGAASLASAAQAQRAPSPPPPGYASAIAALDEAAGRYVAPSDGVYMGGVLTYFFVGVTGTYLAYNVLIPPHEGGLRLQHVAAGATAAALANTVVVYAADGGGFVPMAGAALLSQVAVYGGVYGLGVLNEAAGRSRDELFAWMSPFVMIGASVAATSAAHYVGYRTGGQE